MKRTILILTLLMGAAVPALGQTSFAKDNATSDIAPGTPVWSSAVSCDANTTTCYFSFDPNTGTAAADRMPIPDGSTVVVSSRGTSGACTCCWVDDATATVGDQSAAATINAVDEDGGGAGAAEDGGACYEVPYGQIVALHENHLARQNAPGYFSGVCDAASAHDRAPDYDVYLSCAADPDCASIGGTGSGSACSTAAAVGVGAPGGGNPSRDPRRVRGAFLACRCSAAAILVARIER